MKALTTWSRIVLAAVGMACAMHAGAEPLKIAMSGQITSMDPHYVNLFPNNNIAEHVFEKLVTLDADSHLVPGLAESWRLVSPTVWEFKLRRNVSFHDGHPFTADDVVATIARVPNVKNSPGPFTVYVRAIASTQIVDAHTIRFTTREPYPLLPNDLSTIYIVEAKYRDAPTEDFNNGRAMIGTGPFKFVSYRSGDAVELVRNDAYWGRKPDWERVTFRQITNSASRVAALLANDVQVIENVPTPDLQRIRDNRILTTIDKVSHRVIFLTLDSFRDVTPDVTAKDGKPLDRNPLKDARVRQALSLAIDREAIKARVMEGLAVPTKNLVPNTLFGHNAALAPDPYNPGRAKALLAEAGFADGFAVTIHAPNNRYVNDEQIAQTIAQMWTRIGVTTRVDAMPMSALLAHAPKNEYSVAMLGWGAATGEASSPLRTLLATVDKDRGNGSFNWGRYSNKRVDALLDDALKTTEDARRLALLQEAVGLAMNDVGLLPIHHQVTSWAMRKDIVYAARTDEYTLAWAMTRRR